MNNEKPAEDVPGQFFRHYGERIVWALRRINRVMDVHSRFINRSHRITSPQMLCLLALSKRGPLTLGELAKTVNLGFSTLTGIIDRLEIKELVRRKRSDQDRRKVFLHVTPEGERLSCSAPVLLQDKLLIALSELSDLEQATMALSLERLVQLIDAKDFPQRENDPEPVRTEELTP